ncbi:DNA helicase Rep [Saccharophagus degradans]|uniref:ATP-dependent DNA helicase Rep n=2 Tax=Saccharophagus degradans TaxID=86304 RepID=Q21PD1_SACD2|nr:DNA helicase Rep [Saccharophagus degradans]ABD79448.1 ATP-dependent DNA helicase Rep [Saccharophagus degradans 2-40]MBU2986880.1 DNA helicase Rep [Saccharophagus degradans]MDO6423280.1 DNA helicase Rep [Saccharophagus degradans]MDO6606685.1 DNA helicase Rep [Saccharophagus degradans]
MTTLNPRQKEAVHYIDGPSLVLAGAGSGKTSVITRKIAYMIQECGIPARHIAAVTFTNKAAREMKERVTKLVKGSAARGLTVSTFHNLGLNIIRREHKTLGFKSGFTIFDQEDARGLIKEIMLKDGDTNTDMIDLVQSQISNWKNGLIEPDEALSKAQSEGEQTWALVFERYNKALKAYNAVDFDDLIRLPSKLFSEHPEVLNRWQQRIRYLLVDEYQDTNSSQYKVVQQLIGDRGTLTVVGDDDQSIYAWRGARPENMSLLKVDFPSLHVIKLEQNYRSTARILKAANVLIANNPHEFDKTLWSDLGMGETIRVIKCPTEDAEAERVATEILTQRLRRQCKFKDFAVLYRGNHQARLMELKLQHHQIPYNISGGTSFFARAEIKDIMGYLRLIANPADDNAFLRVVNTPRRQIGTGTLEALGRYSTERDISLWAACDEMGLQALIPKQGLERIRKFSGWLNSVRSNCHNGDPVQAIREMIDDIDYEGWLHQNASSPKVAEKRFENVNILVESIKNSLERDENEDADGEERINTAISKLLLQDMLERQEEEDETDRVQLMTLHASKGLEFPHVFLLGLEEEILPHRNSIEEDNIEEERRLAYVGITRAQRTLTMTLAGTRKQFGEKQTTTPSRFLDELPPEDVEREGFSEATPEQIEKKGKETLSSLKGMFD